MQLPLAGQPRPLPVAGPVWLALGFRPFFLLASGYGVVLVAVWVTAYLGWLRWLGPLPPLVWHAHEMLFGFAAAAVAGFLLTAVPNWTGLPTLRGWPLGALVALWLTGRIAVACGPRPLAAALDLAFLPLLGIALAIPLVRARQARNLIFLPVLAALTAADILFWLGLPGALQLGITCILMLVVLIGGRVIPFFIRAALPGSSQLTTPWVETAAVVSLPVLLAAELLGLDSRPLAGLYLLAAGVHGLRLAGWYDRRIWGVPLLWVLVVGYGWLAIGLALQAQACWSGGNPRPALHALTAGCMGTLILGMMARVSLGHSGRPLVPHPLVARSFAVLTLAGALRVFGPLLLPGVYVWWVGASGLLWSVAFGIFAVLYAPILTAPRADGRPG